MANDPLKFIFANSLAALTSHCDQVGELKRHKRDLCRSVAIAFYLSESIGDSAYSNSESVGSEGITGFESGSQYSLIEASIKATLSAYPATSGLADEQRSVLAAAVNAIVFGYSSNPNVPAEELAEIIGTALYQASRRVIGQDVFEFVIYGDYAYVVHPFSGAVIRGILKTYSDYAETIELVSKSEKNLESDLVHYNYYDTNTIFHGPDLDKMKDSENQYYYLSGKLIYPEYPSDISFCEETTAIISTETGNKTINVVKNQPCVDKSTFTAPITGVGFNRVFNDGPYSSGAFSKSVKEAYMNFDRVILTGLEYSGNWTKLYSYNLIGTGGSYHNIYLGGVSKDIEGEYNLATEYANAPMGSECSPVNQVMRVGDVRLRSACKDGKYSNGICSDCDTEKITTGLKYAVMSMNDGWEPKFDYIVTNPPTKIDRTLIRGLNIASNPYIGSEASGGIIAANWNQGLSRYEWYAGPPQIGQSDLPYFAFTSSFENGTYDQLPSVILYPCIGYGNDSVNFGESARTFSVSSRPILTGTGTSFHTVESIDFGEIPRAEFYKIIPSYSGGDDDTKTKFFGMGNSFSGKYTGTSALEENAGYFYTGYVLKDSKKVSYSINDLASSWAGYKVGSPHKTVKYISGYTGQNSLEMNRMIGQDQSGNSLEYYYFDNRLLPNGVTIEQTGWSSFSPLPEDIEADPSYGRAYHDQEVENSHQRYYRGPYAAYSKKFLYPNAKKAEALQSIHVGFPVKYKYKIVVREEAVKEIYCKYKISNGEVYTIPNYVPIIRPDQSNFKAEKPRMVNIFSDSSREYDFNQWGKSTVGTGFFYTKSLVYMVNNDWSPGSSSNMPIGKNPTRYHNSENAFRQGILITGSDIDSFYKLKTGSGTYDYQTKFTIKDKALGLYHGFSRYEITGYITYIPPIYNIEQEAINRSPAAEAMEETSCGCIQYKRKNDVTVPYARGLNLLTKQMNGSFVYPYSGQDPIYFYDMGGRRGSSSATGEGGYHPKGIIGDRWVGLNMGSFGYSCDERVDAGYCSGYFGETGLPYLDYNADASLSQNRVPYEDSRIFFLNATQEDVKIVTRALDFNPMVFDNHYVKFSEDNDLPTVSKSISLEFDKTFESFKFDLGKAFPKIESYSGSSLWYVGSSSDTGVTIGPFDRDVEVFAIPNTRITGYNSLYINKRKVSDLENGKNSTTQNNYTTNNFPCYSPKYISGDMTYFSGSAGSDITLYGGTGIFEHKNIKTLAIIPENEKIILNMKVGKYTFSGLSGPSGPGWCAYIGCPSKSYLYIRARNVLGEETVDGDTTNPLTNELILKRVTGEQFFMDRFNFVNNGSEREFSISSTQNNLASLVGQTQEFLTFSRTGKLYNIPEDEGEYERFEEDFNVFRRTGAYGNLSYSIDGVEEFYRKKTETDRASYYSSGWREGSRLSFEFKEMEPVYDQAPHMIHPIVIPSGTCIVSGELGYYGQADRAIFSEGIVLEDVTRDDRVRSEIYGPKFVSKVLDRLPFFDYPTGNTINPVLEAPSIMKQRADALRITTTPKYNGIYTKSPQNYNKLLWPALSDLKVLNSNETMEEIPPDDGNTFLNSSILISAALGQRLPNGRTNPNTPKIYAVRDQYQMYDSVATDALINSGLFITTGRGLSTALVQPKSGHTVPIGTTLTEIELGLV